MTQPSSLREAKAALAAERDKLRTAVSAVAGSRWLTAVLAALALAFGAHLVFAPQRLPTVEGVSFVQVGLPPNLDFGAVGERAVELHAKAQQAGARGRIEAAIETRAAEDARFVPLLNAIGFAVALALLLANLRIVAARLAGRPAAL